MEKFIFFFVYLITLTGFYIKWEIQVKTITNFEYKTKNAYKKSNPLDTLRHIESVAAKYIYENNLPHHQKIDFVNQSAESSWMQVYDLVNNTENTLRQKERFWSRIGFGAIIFGMILLHFLNKRWEEGKQSLTNAKTP